MTTPARTKNVFTFSDYFRDDYAGGSSLTGSHYKSQDQDIRPASSPAVRIGRFKKCHEWVHSGGKMVKGDSVSKFHVPGIPALWFSDRGNIWDGLFPDPIPVSSNMRNACLTKALGKLKSQEFHIGNFVAESHKAIEMIQRRAETIAHQVIGFRTKFPKLFALARSLEGSTPRSRWCEIPKLWLELQYGWTPLISDIFGALHHLKKRARFGVPFVTVSAHVEDESYDYTIHSDASGVTNTAKWKSKREVNTFLVYGLENATLAELSSLGLINPLEIVWETVKYSFVVDWFLPIGPWLGALTAGVGYEFITGGQSLITTCTYESSELRSVPPYWTYLQLPKFSASGQRKSFERKCYTSSPVPGLYVKNPISLQHCANALALLAQAFR